MVADVSYHPGNKCDNFVDSIRSQCDDIPTLVVLVSADAEGDDDLSLLRTQEMWWGQRRDRLPRQACCPGGNWCFGVLTSKAFDYIVFKKMNKEG